MTWYLVLYLQNELKIIITQLELLIDLSCLSRLTGRPLLTFVVPALQLQRQSGPKGHHFCLRGYPCPRDIPHIPPQASPHTTVRPKVRTLSPLPHLQHRRLALAALPMNLSFAWN